MIIFITQLLIVHYLTICKYGYMTIETFAVNVDKNLDNLFASTHFIVYFILKKVFQVNVLS